MKHTFKEWFATTRYWSFPVSTMPVVVSALLLAVLQGPATINWIHVLLAVIGVVLFHAAGNLLSDVGDYRSGADSEDAYSVPNLVKGFFTAKQYLVLSGTLFALGIVLGLFLTLHSSWQLLVVGGLGFVMTVLYTRSKNVFLSDLNVFVIYGVLIMLGTSIVAIGSIDWRVLLLSVPQGLITLSVLHANNTVDIANDSKAGIHTIAMALGVQWSARLFVAYQVLPYLWVVLCAACGLMPWTVLIALLSLPVAIGNMRKALGYNVSGREALVGLDLCCAKLQLLFSLTLAAGLLLALFLV